MPNSQIRFSGPFSRAPNLPYRGYPERLSTARTVTIRPIPDNSSAPLSIAQSSISFVTHITVNQLDDRNLRPYSYVYKVRRTSSRSSPSPVTKLIDNFTVFKQIKENSNFPSSYPIYIVHVYIHTIYNILLDIRV